MNEQISRKIVKVSCDEVRLQILFRSHYNSNALSNMRIFYHLEEIIPLYFLYLDNFYIFN